MAPSWEERAADKRKRIDDSIPKEWRIQNLPQGDSVLDFPQKSGLLSSQELAITQSSASDLVKRLAAGELKAVDVTVAFCKRAALAHQLVSIPGHDYQKQYFGKSAMINRVLSDTVKLLLGILP